ncbi:mannose-1-phosphate guanylyltransferase/mannose-6-phosphate isomerase [Shewanella sp. Scap07]|uniref:mannose-1-phosphate guanylyltransferase/mannose-6-phosphate isomerase n=1 Tax=Shewanella sp. Scap07 TaxID=2589987 RepID=UPI0015BC56F8|nr:mannose-1-phosphate guanylyltransferase/mannose-6-phosphate isomerase [Shewanella sp. Scap07]QLE86101.1 mannose-1-phosphate guanylyltransferase/mannose-6-phosphate isomerase [Shewanella sp. Scap07]
MDNSVYPVILSGGSGTRLWPLSRKHYPKQLLRLTSAYTMLQETALRLTKFASPITVCNESHRFMVAEQLQEVAIEPSAIILEPVARNTAPAIALSAFAALAKNAEAALVVLPADHVIEDVEAFQDAVDRAVEVARDGSLVTFGIIPTAPETGYGYIQGTSDTIELSAIAQFVEKPDSATAERYVNSGKFFWNSGMFVFKARAFLDELKKYNEPMYQAVSEAWNNSQGDLDFVRVDKQAFAKSPDDSIDYAVMEKTEKGMVLPIDVGWSDVGSFSALWEVLDKDQYGNVSLGDVKSIDSSNCLVQSENQFVATIGVKDLVVIGTKDSILVAHKDHVQQVKDVVEHLKTSKRSEHLLHREVYRPWGSYDSIEEGHRFQVKRIVVKPGASLSLQMHHHRAEHWIVVSGTALVEVSGKEILLAENESVYIPLGATHRLTNPGKIKLELIEVQSGSYLGEDDIVRLEDKFGRC